MINEAIVLAGGLGTRLRCLLKDVPKPMADVGGKPFLEYLLNFLVRQGIERLILSVGYKYEVIAEYFGERYCDLAIEYSIEEEPLGTGGAIKKALPFLRGSSFFILNGDTYFGVDLKKLYQLHQEKNADLSIALKPMRDFDRYGTVYIDEDNRITGFEEKKHRDFSFINGGIYLANKIIFEKIELPDKFSFERDFIEKNFERFGFYGFPFDNYFIDIGIPEDYERAKKELTRFVES